MVLNKIYKDFHLPLDLYSKLKQSIKYNLNQDIEDLNDFVECLPYKLQVDVSLFIHEKTYRTFVFLKQQSSSFIAWICPHLKP